MEQVRRTGSSQILEVRKRRCLRQIGILQEFLPGSKLNFPSSVGLFAKAYWGAAGSALASFSEERHLARKGQPPPLRLPSVY